MPRLVTANCPRCGAALELRPGLELVTCTYCGFRSMIEWEGRRRPPTPPPITLDPSLGRIVAKAPEVAAKAVMVFVIAGVVVPAVLGAVMFVVLARPSPSVPTPPIGAPPDGPAAVPTVTPAPPLGPRMVDAADLVKKARTLALEVSPDPVLASAVFFNVQGGLVDTQDANAGSIDFEFQRRDPKAPPGKDVTNLRFMAHVSKGNMSPSTMSWGAPDRDRKLDVPACPSLSAWGAAVQSGVPQNAVATLHLYYNGSFTPKSPTVWSVRVDGHDEYRREIDARTCQVVKNWGAPTTSAPRRR